MKTSSTPSRASSSPSSAHSWTYDVFLCYRGADTRYHFTDHLYSSLLQKGIKTFFADEVLNRGEELTLPTILQTIGESRISLLVISENFASSEWCLDELEEIMRCKESKNRTVWSIFIKVDPLKVRDLHGSFGQAFVNHETKYKDDMEKVMRWRTSLTDAANLPAWIFGDGHESNFIENIIQEISVRVLNRTYLNVAKYLVGMESRTQDMYQLLGVGVDDVRTIGIYGIAGIGKTTVAKTLYNSIVHMFEVGYFVKSVQDNSTIHGEPIQPHILYEILGGKQMQVVNVDEQISVIRDMLRHKRVLLIIDDVKQIDELSLLMEGSERLGLGSRIIITTRDKNLLTSHQVNLIYEVKELDFGEAFELFSWNAFQSKLPHDYAKLATTIVHYARGLPLGLMVLGSLLRGKTIDQWKTIFDGYQRAASNLKIQEILQISYNALEDSVKEVFLHIACFLNGKDMNYVIKMLDSFHHNPEYGIEVLKEKSLISIDENHIQMIDLLEEMGKEIVHEQESLLEPGQCSRLWFYKDFNHVLLENTDRKRLKLLKKDIVIKMPTPDDLNLTAKSFSKVTSADWTYLIVGLILEIASVFFDQESSPRKPLYAFFGMLLAIAALLTSTCELIHKGIKERVTLRRCGILRWFHYPSFPYVLFGDLPNCFGILSSIFQCICSTIQYVYYIRRGTNPIKVSLLPAMFLICVALSRLNWSTRRDEII